MDIIIRTALPVLGAVVLFPYRNILRVPIDIVQGRPIRIDLPLPYLQLDVVLVSDPQQIQVRPTLSESAFKQRNPISSDVVDEWQKVILRRF